MRSREAANLPRQAANPSRNSSSLRKLMTGVTTRSWCFPPIMNGTAVAYGHAYDPAGSSPGRITTEGRKTASTPSSMSA